MTKGGENGLGGLRRRILVVRPRMVTYPRRTTVRRVVLEGEPREREAAKAASLRLEMGGVVGLMEKAEISETRLGE